MVCLGVNASPKRAFFAASKQRTGVDAAPQKQLIGGCGIIPFFEPAFQIVAGLGATWAPSCK